MIPKRVKDRQVVASARNLLAEYLSLLELVKEDLTSEIDAELIDGKDAFEIARKTIRRESRKEALSEFINRIKTYGNQQI